jgi:hypothetical protein
MEEDDKLTGAQARAVTGLANSPVAHAIYVHDDIGRCSYWVRGYGRTKAAAIEALEAKTPGLTVLPEAEPEPIRTAETFADGGLHWAVQRFCLYGTAENARAHYENVPQLGLHKTPARALRAGHLWLEDVEGSRHGYTWLDNPQAMAA